MKKRPKKSPARKRKPKKKPARKSGRVMVARRMYESARQTRLTSGWQSTTGSADSEIYTSLTSLRNRSRALIRDSSYAKRARTIVVNNVIGSGMGLQAQVRSSRTELRENLNDAIEEAWERWSLAENCHTGGSLHFSDIERLAMGEVFEAGEVFVRLHFRPFGRSDVPLGLEVIEAERVPHDLGAIPMPENVRLGLEVDEFLRPVAYWIREQVSSDLSFDPLSGRDQAIRVPADSVIHLRIITRWPQTRGVPWLHTAAKKLNDMDGYSDAEITAARGAANYMGWQNVSDLDAEIESENGEQQEDGTYVTELAPGIIGRGPPGSEIQFNNPNRPNSALDPFMRYMLREVASGADVSYESLSRDYSQSNYSSSRLALVDDRDMWRVLQQWFIRSFRDVVHRAWIRQAALVGAIPGMSLEEYALNPAKFEAVKYKPRGWSWIDPTKEVEAYREAVRNGFMSRGDVVALTGSGNDLEDIDEARAREIAAAEALELQYDVDAPPKTAEPAKSEKPNAEEPPVEDDGEDATDRKMRVVK